MSMSHDELWGFGTCKVMSQIRKVMMSVSEIVTLPPLLG